MTTSRGSHFGNGSQYVQNRRPRNRLRHHIERGVWGYLLDNDFILTKKLDQSVKLFPYSNLILFLLRIVTNMVPIIIPAMP